MTSIRNKKRPFRLLKYLYENTDEEHPISTAQLVDFGTCHRYVAQSDRRKT